MLRQTITEGMFEAMKPQVRAKVPQLERTDG